MARLLPVVEGAGGEHPVDVGAEQADLGGAQVEVVHGISLCQPSKSGAPGMTVVTTRTEIRTKVEALVAECPNGYTVFIGIPKSGLDKSQN